jgi:hypothetical protein
VFPGNDATEPVAEDGLSHDSTEECMNLIYVEQIVAPELFCGVLRSSVKIICAQDVGATVARGMSDDMAREMSEHEDRCWKCEIKNNLSEMQIRNITFNPHHFQTSKPFNSDS